MISTITEVPQTDDSQIATTAIHVRHYVEHSKSDNTRRAYRADWADFAAWCDGHMLPSLPAASETVALYITDLAEAGRKTSTIQRRLSAISQAHQLAGYASPTHDQLVRSVAAGIRRMKGTAQDGKAPALIADIRMMVDALPDSLLGTRDRALLLLGFAGAFRRSELVALDVAHLEETSDGLVVTIRRSKTDQEGAGRKVGIPYGSNPATCPVRAIRTWLSESNIEDGPLFRGINRHGRLQSGRLVGRSVARIVQRSAEATGLDPSKYAGHSLRAGLATSAAAAGVSERAIMNQTGHKSLPILRKYIREGSLFRENAAARVGL